MGVLSRSFRKSTMILLTIALIATTLFVSLSAAGDAHRQRGMDTASELCGGDGYKSLTKQDGTPFRDERDCIRYAMRNGGVSALATAAPTPSSRRTTLQFPLDQIDITLPPRSLVTPTPVPTSAPGQSAYIKLLNFPEGTCRITVSAQDLKILQEYILAVNVKEVGGETVIYEYVLDPPMEYSDTYSEAWEPNGVTREVTAYLYEIQGDALVQVDFAGPLILDDECEP